ncbi:unnamed protein product [Musa acuminata subsp. burmannicoides]
MELDVVLVFCGNHRLYCDSHTVLFHAGYLLSLSLSLSLSMVHVKNPRTTSLIGTQGSFELSLYCFEFL